MEDLWQRDAKAGLHADGVSEDVEATDASNITASEGFKGKVHACPIEEGGVYAAFWKLAQECRVGLRIRQRDIPLRQETVELANMLDVDPYRMDSGNCFLIFAENGPECLEMLRQQGMREATVVGITTGDKKRLIANGDGERFLTKPCIS